MEENSLKPPRVSPSETAGETLVSQRILADRAAIFFVLFFLSGMCALIYEITWTRRLTFIFGNTIYSVSTVLVAFMGGLAFGSMLFGRLVDRRQEPLRTYGWLEIGIGVSAALLPVGLWVLKPASLFLFSRVGGSNYIMTLARFVLATAVLIVPTTLMGATLPVLSKFIVRRADETGFEIGSLYGINTLGAVVGCFLAGFVLIGWIGISRSEHVAVVINIVVGLIAFGLNRQRGQVSSDVKGTDELEGSVEGPRYREATLRFVLLIFAVSGMLALAYEVLWTRILVFLLGSSVYSFSMILVVYLLGLTAGSLGSAKVADRLKRPLLVFGWVEIFIGVSVLIGLSLFYRLPFLQYALDVSPLSYLGINFLCTFAIVLPPTLLMGAAFPLAVRVYTRSLGHLGQQTGTLYAANTVGAILGSFVSGFVLIPFVGSKNSMMLLILLSIAAGCSLLFLSMKQEGAPVMNWLAGGILIVPLLGFPFGNELMKDLSARFMEDGQARVLAFDEDATAAVAVVVGGGDFRMLSVNGAVMTILCTETQLMAHIPLALLDDPESVLNICFGMGTTFVSARRAGMDVDFVELCPYVVETFEYFQKDPSMLNEPGVGRVVADGRNYLFLSDKVYDVITIDPPPPPWSAGTVNLCTEEFYELCKARLAPGGIVCQWFPTAYSSLTEDQFKMLLRTYMEVFPHTTVWDSPNELGMFLIGTPERLRIDQESFEAYFDAPAIRDDLSLYSDKSVDGRSVLSLLVLDEDEARSYAAGAPVMRDDLPLIEFPLFRTDPSTEIMRASLLYTHKMKELGAPYPSVSTPP